MQHKHLLAARRQQSDGFRQAIQLTAGVDVAVVAGGFVGGFGQFVGGLDPRATGRFHAVPVDRQVDGRAPQVGHGRRDRLARRLRKQAHAHVMDDIPRKASVRAKAPAQQIDQLVVVTDQHGKQGRGGGIAGHRAVMRSGKVLNCK